MRSALISAIMALAITGAKADDYNPIPPGWSIKINLPGLLSASTEYCTQMGQCAWVGNDVIGPHGERCLGDLVGPRGEVYPRLEQNSKTCLKARLPVQVLAVSPTTGVAIARLKGRNYAVAGSSWQKMQLEPDGSLIGGPVSVVYEGKSIPLHCFLVAGPCPPTPHYSSAPGVEKPRASGTAPSSVDSQKYATAPRPAAPTRAKTETRTAASEVFAPSIAKPEARDPAPIASLGQLKGQTGLEWMESAPAFCRSKAYGSLTSKQMAVCEEAAFRHLSKNWQTITAANGQAYEIALDTVHRNLPNNVDPGADLRAATVVVYISEGEMFNPANVVHFYFDCHDRFQTFQRHWSQVSYAPPLSVAAKITSIACVEASEQQTKTAAPGTPNSAAGLDPNASLPLQFREIWELLKSPSYPEVQELIDKNPTVLTATGEQQDLLKMILRCRASQMLVVGYGIDPIRTSLRSGSLLLDNPLCTEQWAGAMKGGLQAIGVGGWH
jgi:hypothetical protein